MSCGASKTVVPDGNGAILDLLQSNIPKKDRFAILPLQTELLVEVAVENLTAPADAQRFAAHEAGDRGGIKGLDQKVHVLLELAMVPQPRSKAGYGHVRDRVEMIEINVEMPFQLAFVIGFQFPLVRREKGSVGIVNKIELQRAIASVADSIQELKCLNTGIEDALTALGVDIRWLIAGHRGNHFHPMLSKKPGQPVVARFQKDLQIATIDDRLHLWQGPQAPDQVAEIRDHLGRSTRKVHGMDVGADNPVKDAVNRFASDDLFPLRAGVHMAVDAGEIAEFADVYLKDCRTLAPESEAVGHQRACERPCDRGTGFG